MMPHGNVSSGTSCPDEDGYCPDVQPCVRCGKRLFPPLSCYILTVATVQLSCSDATAML